VREQLQQELDSLLAKFKLKDQPLALYKAIRARVENLKKPSQPAKVLNL